MTKKTNTPFIMLTGEMLDHKNWIELSKSANLAYQYLLHAQFKKTSRGKTLNTNGLIAYGKSDCPVLSSHSFVSAMVELRNEGFVKLVTAGKFPNKKAVYSLISKWKTLEKENQIEGLPPST